MRLSALPYLRCPASGSALRLAPGMQPKMDGPHVVEGVLITDDEKPRRYEIVRGIPRLGPQTVHPAAVETASRFATEWKTFSHEAEYQKDWLSGWLSPLGPADFRGKVVFEGGCGKGRHSYIMGKDWGVKEIVSLDLGDAVEVAFQHTKDLPNVHIVQGDLLNPPVALHSFDVAFSVGVLHHLHDPRGGFERLVSLVKPGGIVACWVYGRENNEWIVRFVNPVREHVTSKIPHALLYWGSLPLSVGLSAWTRLYRTSLGDKLPYGPYMKLLSTVPLREVHLIVYDQLVTPLAEYLPREEVEDWFRVQGLGQPTIRWHNEHSWACNAVVPDSAQA